MASGSNAKHGRNSAFCKSYRNMDKAKKAKEKRMKKHAEMYPKKSKYSAAQRRIMGKMWKVEADRRANPHKYAPNVSSVVTDNKSVAASV